jgi:hypothetical protein
VEVGVSRTRRNEVGLNIVCHVHPGEVLFWPRMSLDGSGRLREAGPRGVMRGIKYATGGGYVKMSRDCPRAGCVVHAEYRRELVKIAMVGLAQRRVRGIWTMTDNELSEMIRTPARIAYYLAWRAALRAGPPVA